MATPVNVSGFTKRQREERTVFLKSPMGTIIKVPKARADQPLGRAVIMGNGTQGKYTRATKEEIKFIKEPATNPDAELVLGAEE